MKNNLGFPRCSFLYIQFVREIWMNLQVLTLNESFYTLIVVQVLQNFVVFLTPGILGKVLPMQRLTIQIELLYSLYLVSKTCTICFSVRPLNSFWICSLFCCFFTHTFCFLVNLFLFLPTSENMVFGASIDFSNAQN